MTQEGRKDKIARLYTPRHPQLCDGDHWATHCFADQSNDSNIEEVASGVFRVPQAFDPVLCREIVEEVKHFSEQSKRMGFARVPPSIYVTPGAVLNEIPNLSACLSQVIAQRVEGVVRRLLGATHFAPVVEGTPTLNAADFLVFVALHTPEGDATQDSVPPHLDDACVAVNVCLGVDDFQGGELEVFPRNLDSADTSDTGEGQVLPQRVGDAFIHHGSLLHSVRPVTAGERAALVMWLVSTKKTIKSKKTNIMKTYTEYLAHMVPGGGASEESNTCGSRCIRVPMAYHF